MRKLLELIRANDWWEYKLPPMLAVAYIVLAQSKLPFIDVAGVFPVILAALITGAAYVSLINDATDIADDAAAGKPNKMAGFNRLNTNILVLTPLVVAATFIQFFFGWESLTGLFYILSYACFTLYSMPPFRLKKRGFAGILADASGSQVFPTLFIWAYLAGTTNQTINMQQLLLVGSWLLCFGLRGILWHQLHDAENDRKSGLVTFVQKLVPHQIKHLGGFIIAVELLCFLTFVISSKLWSALAALLLYIAFVLFTSKTLKIKQTLITPLPGRTRIFMFEFYQIFLPVIVLCQCFYNNPFNILALFIHILLFPKNIIRIFREMIG